MWRIASSTEHRVAAVYISSNTDDRVVGTGWMRKIRGSCCIKKDRVGVRSVAVLKRDNLVLRARLSDEEDDKGSGDHFTYPPQISYEKLTRRYLQAFMRRSGGTIQKMTWCCCIYWTSLQVGQWGME